MLWFTADTHFGHAKIVDYCKRPFATITEMDAALVERWNTRVGAGDEVWHLGDFAFGRFEIVARYRTQLRGRIHLVWGNHDRRTAEVARLFASTHDLVEIGASADGQLRRIVLCHYAMRVWPKSHHGAWHLFGHSHGSLPDDPYAMSMDVGADCWGFAPISLDEIAAHMAKKSQGRIGEGHSVTPGACGKEVW